MIEFFASILQFLLSVFSIRFKRDNQGDEAPSRWSRARNAIVAAILLAVIGIAGVRFGLMLGITNHGPIAFVAAPSVELGSMSITDSPKASFEILNAGDEDLELGAITVECSCSAMEVSSKTIAPGKTATIDLMCRDGSKRLGDCRALAVIETNDVRKPRILLSSNWKFVAD